MPLYDYHCDRCGPFTESRPMAEHRSMAHCPFCDDESPRVITAPSLATSSAENRYAHGVNERAAHAPKTSAEVHETARQAKTHGAGCSCCSGGAGKKSTAVKTADGSVRFPSKRPWMISH